MPHRTQLNRKKLNEKKAKERVEAARIRRKKKAIRLSKQEAEAKSE